MKVGVRIFLSFTTSCLTVQKSRASKAKTDLYLLKGAAVNSQFCLEIGPQKHLPGEGWMGAGGCMQDPGMEKQHNRMGMPLEGRRCSYIPLVQRVDTAMVETQKISFRESRQVID